MLNYVIIRRTEKVCTRNYLDGKKQTAASFSLLHPGCLLPPPISLCGAIPVDHASLDVVVMPEQPWKLCTTRKITHDILFMAYY